MGEGFLWLWWIFLFPVFIVIIALIAGAQRKTLLEKILFFMIPVGLLICIYRRINFGRPEIGDLEVLILLVLIIYILGRNIMLGIINISRTAKNQKMSIESIIIQKSKEKRGELLFTLFSILLFTCLFLGINFGKEEIGDVELVIVISLIIYILIRSVMLLIKK